MKKYILLITIITNLTFMLSAQKSGTQRYTPELMWRLERISDVQVSEKLNKILYGVSWYDLASNKSNRDLYTMPLNGDNAQQVTNFAGGESNGVFSSKTNKIRFLSSKSGKSQIWEANIDGSNPRQISDLENDIIEFKFSPDETKVVLIHRIKLDETPNEFYPDLPLANARIEDDLMYRHWDSWSDYSYNHIFIADMVNGKVVNAKDIMKNQRFDTPMLPWGGIEQINWSIDSKQIAYTCKKMVGKEYAINTNSEIYLYDISTGKEQIISKGLLGYDHDPVFSPDGKYIAWKSMERNGFEADKERIMIYDIKAATYTDYSKGFDQSASSYVWSSDSKTLYFLSPYKGAVQVFSLNLANKKFTQITNDTFDYLSIAVAGNDLIVSKQSFLFPTDIYKIKPDGSQVKLSTTNDNILKDVELASVKERWITTTDNKQMHCWVVYPPNFDPNKKYPTILFCEGGPQSMVSQFFSYRWNFRMMASKGYIVVAPNRRGLPGFGQEWNDQISGDYGGQNMKDYLSAIDDMMKEPYVDKDRLGAVGASYGGFSVFWLAGHHEKRFKTFISHCGMFNLEQQYLTTEEMWFVNWDLGGPYWEKNNPKVKHSYENSPHRFVDKWDTPIMVIHGENDFRIPFTQGMAAYNAAKLRGIPARYLHFPDESHWVLKPQNGVLWQREFFRWLDKWLK